MQRTKIQYTRLLLQLPLLSCIGRLVYSQSSSFLVSTCDTSSSNYFQQFSLQCSTCSAIDNKVVDGTGMQILGSRSQCLCAEGFYETYPSCDTTLPDTCPDSTCTTCPVGTASTRDRSTCLSCDGSTAILGSLDCECANSTHVLIERDTAGNLLTAKKCIACPVNQRAFPVATGDFPADPYTCVSCGDPNMVATASGTCECESGYTLTGVASVGQQRCVLDSDATTVLSRYNQEAASLITFRAYQSSADAGEQILSGVSSIVIRHYFTWAAVSCWNYRDSRDDAACDILASLCVLHMYDNTAVPCQVLDAIASARGGAVNGWQGWTTTLPFTQYSVDASAILSSTVLQMSLSFNSQAEPGTVDSLDLVIATYAMNGTLISLEPLTSQFEYCSTSSIGSDTPDWQRFGYSTRLTATCSLNQLVKASKDSSGSPSLFLHELYIVDTDGASSSDAADSSSLPIQLFPVPVRIRNLVQNGETPNSGAAIRSTSSVLVRRFLLYDGVSGLSDATSTPRVIRYARRIVLEVATQSDRKRILPPLVTIEYRERQPQLFSADSNYAKDQLITESLYISNADQYWAAVTALFSISMLIMAMLTGLRCFIHRRRTVRDRDAGFVLADIGWFGVFLAGSFAQTGFWLLWIMTLYWLVFFKLQDTIFQLLPAHLSGYNEDGAYIAFKVMIWLIFVGHAIRLFEVMWRQTHIDIFFIDWERRRGPLLRTALTSPDYDQDDPMENESKAVGAMPSTARAMGRQKHAYAPISIWRQLFMVNEWSELQANRRIHPTFTLIFMLIIMEAANYKYVATARPDASDLTPGELNPLLQFAHNVFWWFILSLGQYLWMWGIYQRFIEPDPFARFIDLCTVAKVSVFVLDDKYHGYYLHCDAPYEHADVNMQQLTDHLQDEQGNVRVGRGLKGVKDPTLQTFELYLPHIWRQQFDAIYRKYEQQRARLTLQTGGGSHLMVQSGLNAQSSNMRLKTKQPKLRNTKDKAITRLQHATADKISNFLRGFVNEDDSGPKVRREWRDPSYCQRFFNVPWDIPAEEKSAKVSGGGGLGSGGVGGIAVMTADPYYRVEKVMFRGQEWTLLLWDLLLYCLVDYYTDSPVVSAMVTWLFYIVLNYLRVQLGQRNLARKTMVDERFLD